VQLCTNILFTNVAFIYLFASTNVHLYSVTNKRVQHRLTTGINVAFRFTITVILLYYQQYYNIKQM